MTILLNSLIVSFLANSHRSLVKNDSNSDSDMQILSDSSADSGPSRGMNQSAKGTNSSDEKPDEVSKPWELSEEQQLKHAMEISANEAKQLQLLNHQGKVTRLKTTPYSVPAVHQDESEEERGLFGGTGGDSDDELLNALEESEISGVTPVGLQSSKKVGLNVVQQQKTHTRKEEAITIESDTAHAIHDYRQHETSSCDVEIRGDVCAPSCVSKDSIPVDCTVISDSDEQPLCEGKEAKKRVRDQSQSNDCNTSDGSVDTDCSASSKRRKILYSYSRKRSTDTSLCSLMDRKPTLAKFEGNLLDKTPSRAGLNQCTSEEKSIDLKTAYTRDDFQTSEFSEQDIAQAIAMSLQDQVMDSVLTRHFPLPFSFPPSHLPSPLPSFFPSPLSLPPSLLPCLLPSPLSLPPSLLPCLLPSPLSLLPSSIFPSPPSLHPSLLPSLPLSLSLFSPSLSLFSPSPPPSLPPYFPPFFLLSFPPFLLPFSFLEILTLSLTHML